MGFKNEPIAKLLNPTITSVDQPAFEMGRLAAQMFIELNNNKGDEPPYDIILKPKLVIRESTQKSGGKFTS